MIKKAITKYFRVYFHLRKFPNIYSQSYFAVFVLRELSATCTCTFLLRDRFVIHVFPNFFFFFITITNRYLAFQPEISCPIIDLISAINKITVF